MAEIVKINGIPVYDAIITDDETGMLKISLVDDPAVMSNFLAFDTNKKVMMFAVEDEEKRLVLGVVMRADFPIYRYDKKAGEYYVMYKADTIRTMAEKYLAEGRQNNVNTMHEDNSDVDGVQMVQCFIKDSAKGIVPAGFDDIADGSLFAEFHVTNDEVWDAIKEGTYQGFSLEGIFDLVPEKDQEEVDDIVSLLDGAFSRLFKNSNHKTMSKIKKIKAMLAQALMELGNVTTDKGILVWDGDEDLKAGDAVFFEDADGNRTTPEDGDYKTEDGKVIVVADGKVAEIKDADAQVAPAEEDKFGSKATDKGELIWEGNEDLKAGDAVFVKDENGENVAAPDGDYKTEDGKVIKVAEGKVTEIVDDEAQVADEEAEMKARKADRFNRLVALMSESYDDKKARISEALKAAGYHGWICEAGDDFVVLEVYDEMTYDFKYYQFAIVVTDTDVTIGEYQEVKRGFIPVAAPAAEPAATAEEVAAMKAENENLKAEIAQLKKQPLKQSAHERSNAGEGEVQTGDKGLDRLAKFARKK